MTGVFRRRVQPIQRRRFVLSVAVGQVYEDSLTLGRATSLRLYTGAGAYAFGEENPTQGEERVAWPTWSDGAGGAVEVQGDANWGKLRLTSGEQGRSQVYFLGMEVSYTLTLMRNRYGTGSGVAALEIRGDTAPFAQDAALPAWESYTAPILRSWNYVQVREVMA